MGIRLLVAMVETEVSEVEDGVAEESLTEAEQHVKSRVKASLKTFRRLAGIEDSEEQ